MKKIWKKYSYAITLIILSCSLALIVSFKNHHNDQDHYLKVTISEGDSLWKIADQYAEEHSLSHDEFVSWVQKHNKNINEEIFPGDEIIIPVSKHADGTTTILASAPEE